MTTKPVTITLPAALVDKIDEAAKRDRRNRSNWVAVKLAEILDSEISGEYEPRGIGGGRKPTAGITPLQGAARASKQANRKKKG